MAAHRSSHVRYAPKATVGHQNAIGRDRPEADMAAGPRIVERWERLPASFALDDASLSLGCQPSWVA
jgi:hypothetical protein